MMSVSIIHAPRDEALGEKIAAALNSAGHAARRVSPDPDLGDLHLEAAGLDGDEDGAAIVVWTASAAKLARLHQQAGAAMARGALVPVAVGGARPPGGFEGLPPVDLSGWTGAPDDPRWRFVLEEIQLANQRTQLRDGEVWADPDGESGALEAENCVQPFAPAQSSALETVDAPPAFLARSQRGPLGRRFSAREVAIGASAGLVVMTFATALLAPLILPDIEARFAPKTAPKIGAETTQTDEAATQAAAELSVDPSTETPSILATLAAPDFKDNPVTDEFAGAPAPVISPVISEDAIAALIDSKAGALDGGLALETAPETGENTPLIEAVNGASGGEGEDAIIAEGDADPMMSVATAEGETLAEDDAMKALINSVSGGEETGAQAEETMLGEAGQGADLGDYFRECLDCPDMAALPAGTFRMGATPGEIASDLAEGPARAVTIAKPFAIGAREVTYAQWDACVSAGACRPVPDHGWGRGAHPVVSVSYDDAQSYLAWLSIKTGQSYRLPTEAEWEYAARAGGDSAFAFGSSISVDEANFNGAYPYGGKKGIFRARTTPAASFPPNAFGLYDMHGNAWEWTGDCWNATHAGAPSDGSAATTGDCTQRVLKGGAWNTGGWRLRSAHRIGKPATKREFDNGFRVARNLD